MIQGLPNLGATCWLNTIIQCLRVTKDWKNVKKAEDPFTYEFLKLVNYESDNTTEFLKNLPINPFGDGPSDSQEALLYILDRLERTIKLTDFTGEVTQTIVYPGGRSVSKTPCTVWFNQEKDDVLSGYEDHNGKIHNVAVIKRELTRVPDILVSDKVADELFGKKILAIVHWGFGHYVAYVKENDEWFCVSDSHISKATPILKGYVAFYK